MIHYRSARSFKSILSLGFVVLFACSWNNASQGSDCGALHEELLLESSDVKDQCGTGSCWAHPLTASLEQKIYKEHGIKVSLSEEYLYNKDILNKFKQLVVYSSNSSDTPTWRLTKQHLEGQKLKEGLSYGMVPDEVVQSRVITSSRNIFFNAKRGLFRRLKNIEREILPELLRLDFPDRSQVLEQALLNVEGEFLNKTPGKWQKAADGQERFLFAEQWYTPREFVERYIFQGKKPFEELFRVHESLNFEEMLTLIEGKLKEGETLPVAISWHEFQDFSWFHKTFGSKSGAHALEIVGIIKEDGAIKEIRIKNSWGQYWGPGGGRGNGGFVNIPVDEFFKAFRQLVNFQAYRRLLIPARPLPA